MRTNYYESGKPDSLAVLPRVLFASAQIAMSPPCARRFPPTYQLAAVIQVDPMLACTRPIIAPHAGNDDGGHDSTELLDLFSARIHADGRVSRKTDSLIAGIQPLDSA